MSMGIIANLVYDGDPCAKKSKLLSSRTIRDAYKLCLGKNDNKGKDIIAKLTKSCALNNGRV